MGVGSLWSAGRTRHTSQARDARCLRDKAWASASSSYQWRRQHITAWRPHTYVPPEAHAARCVGCGIAGCGGRGLLGFLGRRLGLGMRRSLRLRGAVARGHLDVHDCQARKGDIIERCEVSGRPTEFDSVAFSSSAVRPPRRHCLSSSPAAECGSAMPLLASGHWPLLNRPVVIGALGLPQLIKVLLANAVSVQRERVF